MRNSEAIACVKLRVLSRRIFIIFSTDLQNYPSSSRVDFQIHRLRFRTALGPALALAERALDEHRARLTDWANATFDVGVFFGGLVARTAAWDVIMSAPALTAAVVKFQ
ncbi:hypothetical protein BJY52DRAFT_1194651 [Lactarius psammicola]|nr:hypothetical protein BJY52DRAFT_1194651 [Lactarius psammicola]